MRRGDTPLCECNSVGSFNVIICSWKWYIMIQWVVSAPTLERERNPHHRSRTGSRRIDFSKIKYDRGSKEGKKLQRGEAAGWVDGRTAAVAMVSRDGHYLCVVRSWPLASLISWSACHWVLTRILPSSYSPQPPPPPDPLSLFIHLILPSGSDLSLTGFTCLVPHHGSCWGVKVGKTSHFFFVTKDELTVWTRPVFSVPGQWALYATARRSTWLSVGLPCPRSTTSSVYNVLKTNFAQELICEESRRIRRC